MGMGIGIILAAVAAQGAPAAATAVQPIEIRFCPEGRVRSYPLDSLRGLKSLLLQNVAIVNRGTAPVSLELVEIELRNEGQTIDSRVYRSEQLANAAKGAAALKAS